MSFSAFITTGQLQSPSTSARVTYTIMSNPHRSPYGRYRNLQRWMYFSYELNLIGAAYGVGAYAQPWGLRASSRPAWRTARGGNFMSKEILSGTSCSLESSIISLVTFLPV